MNLGISQRRDKLAENIAKLAEETDCADAKAAAEKWLAGMNDANISREAGEALLAKIEGCDCELCKAIVADKDLLTKKSFWIFGGDGWAYDIGYGGVDHVLAPHQDVKDVYKRQGHAGEQRAFPAFLRWFPYQPRSAEDRRYRL